MRADSAVAQDLRREPRVRAEGVVELTMPGRTIEARLIDTSGSGFRASHTWVEMESGSVVRFRHSSGSGEARVVWNRIMGDSVESGFNILDP